MSNTKRFINASELHINSLVLAKKISESCLPTIIVPLCRGGYTPALYIQEFFGAVDKSKAKPKLIPVTTSSYVGHFQKEEIKIEGLENLAAQATKDDRILFVDDIFETGRSIQAVIVELGNLMKDRFPTEIIIATLFVKKDKNMTNLDPDFFLETTDNWIVFPHELEGLTQSEIGKHVGFNIFE